MPTIKLLIFFCLLSLLVSPLQAQTGSLSGRIYSDSSGMPLEAVHIHLRHTRHFTQSDSTGHFKFTDIPFGKYTLQLSRIGYKTQEEAVVVSQEPLQLELVMEEALEETGEVVISATLKPIKKSESPIPVEVYSPSFFKKNPSPSLFDAMGMVNGVQPQLNCNVCNTGDIHINGMEGPYTMVLIDGMPIVSSLATVYGLSGIPNSIVKRVEVVKGPAATLYGSESVGGLVNIITKDPGTAPKVFVDLMSTSYLENNVDLSARSKLGKLRGLTGLNYYGFQTRWDKNQDGFTDVTLQNRASLFSRWTLERPHNREAAIALRLLYEDRFGGQMTWTPEWRGTDSIYGESIYTQRAELIGKYQLPTSGEKLLLQYSWNIHHQNSYYGTVPYMANQQVAFVQLLWDKKIGDRHKLLSGLPFRFIYYDDNTSGTQLVNGSNAPGITRLPGIFVQDEWQIAKKWSSLSGLRYDYHNIHGSIWSPRQAFKWTPNGKNTFRISGGNGYRVVSLFTEDHAALSGAREVVILNDLKPERSWNGNINYVRFLNHKYGYVQLDASLFYTYFTNKIVGDFISDPNKILYDNLQGYAISRGFTLNVDASFTNNLKILCGFTLMEVFQKEKTTDTLGLTSEQYIPQLFAPQFSGTYQVSYSFKKLNVTLDYTGRVYGPMHLPVVPNDFRPSQSPWFDLANIQVTKKMKKGIEWYGGVKNLWNFVPKNPILRPNDPFDKKLNDPVDNPMGYAFDPSYNYSAIQGTRFYLGFRLTIL